MESHLNLAPPIPRVQAFVERLPGAGAAFVKLVESLADLERAAQLAGRPETPRGATSVGTCHDRVAQSGRPPYGVVDATTASRRLS